MINLIVLISIAVLTILTHYKGSRILLTCIISFYPAAMLYKALPITDKFLLLGTKGQSGFYSHAIVFGIILAVIFFAIYRITGHESIGYGVNRWINSFLIAGSFVLLIVALSFHVLPAYNLFQIINTDIKGFLLSNWGYVVALVAPIITIWRVAR